MTTIEPLECPECELPPDILKFVPDYEGFISYGLRCPHYELVDGGMLSLEQIFALWNQRVRKILQTKKDKL